MKSTGIVRKMDNLGRVVLPMELRRTFGINENDPLEIFISDGSIILRPYRVGCTNCGEMTGLVNFGNITLCHGCIHAFAARVRASE